MSSPATTSGFSAEARGELGVHLRRPQVREQAELLAQAEDRLLRALGALERVVARVADRAEQHRIGVFRERKVAAGRGSPLAS